MACITKFDIVAIKIVCPDCGETIFGPTSGSQYWDWEDAADAIKDGVYCSGCDKRHTISRAITKRLLP